MKYAELLDMIQDRPSDTHPLKRTACWTFKSISDQYNFVSDLAHLLEENGLLRSPDLEGDGEVQRIDYLYLKDGEGFEFYVYHDLKVELKEYGY